MPACYRFRVRVHNTLYAVHTAEGRKKKTVNGKTRKEVPEKLTSESR
jgi:hypothetical protein